MKWRAIWDKIGQRQVKEVAPAERDCTLCVFTSDVRCILTVQDRTGAELSRLTELSNAPAADPATLVSNAMLKLAAELESRIGNVLIYLDDPELSVVDSRQAKLTHFEGRALAEFGKYQLGGRPTAFASSAYGQTGQTESEKRVVGYLSEDKLSAVLFALGRLAKFATFFGPWSAQHDLARAEEEPVASLTVHGRFSTLTMANEAAGAVAVRHIPIGTASLVEAYGAEYGLSFEEAAKLLKARPRMTLNGKQAHAGTASQAALLPGIDRFASEFAATADYFEYQRLSGRAPRLSLSVIGHEIAGFAEWLHKLLDMEVENAGAAILPDKAGLLNFLEGMRSGLLKLGNQLYDFTGGRFVVSKLNPEGAKAARGESEPKPSLLQSLKGLSSQSVSAASLRPFLPAAAAIVFGIAALAGGYFFLAVPLDDRLTANTAAYRIALMQADQASAQGTKAPTAEPVSWAKDIISIAGLMAYDMKLTHLTLTAAKAGAPAQLLITGSLPPDTSGSLSLIGKFITRMSASASLRKRLTDITFQGASADKDGGGLQFHIVAKLAEPPK